MRLMCVGSYYQHFYYFCKFWHQELIFKFCFKSLRKLPFKCSLAQVNQVQGPLELLSVIIQSTSSNTSRHQIFPECDTARHRWGKATGVGRIDHPCPQGVCSPAERRHKKTPTIIMQGAKCSAGGGGERAGCRRGCLDTGELVYLAQGTVHWCINLEQKVTCLQAKRVINIHEDLRNCVLCSAEWRNSG